MRDPVRVRCHDVSRGGGHHPAPPGWPGHPRAGSPPARADPDVGGCRRSRPAAAGRHLRVGADPATDRRPHPAQLDPVEAPADRPARSPACAPRCLFPAGGIPPPTAIDVSRFPARGSRHTGHHRGSATSGGSRPSSGTARPPAGWLPASGPPAARPSTLSVAWFGRSSWCSDAPGVCRMHPTSARRRRAPRRRCCTDRLVGVRWQVAGRDWSRSGVDRPPFSVPAIGFGGFGWGRMVTRGHPDADHGRLPPRVRWRAPDPPPLGRGCPSRPDPAAGQLGCRGSVGHHRRPPAATRQGRATRDRHRRAFVAGPSTNRRRVRGVHSSAPGPARVVPLAMGGAPDTASRVTGMSW